MRPPPVAVLAASAVTLILVGRPDALLAGPVGGARAVGRAAFVPAEAAGAAAFRPLGAVGAGLAAADDRARAEAEAAGQREQAAAQAARAEALSAENARLATLLHLDGAAAGDGIAARVVSLGATPGATLVLDRGSDDGIAVDMPVVAAGALAGRVIEVGPHDSVVLPVTAATSAVGVRVVAADPVAGGPGDGAPAGGPATGGSAAGGPAGVGQGGGGRVLRLELLDPGAPAHGGDLVVTSGLRHSRFPAGLAVGRLGGGRRRLVVEPLAPPDRLEVVKVLRWRPEA